MQTQARIYFACYSRGEKVQQSTPRDMVKVIVYSFQQQKEVLSAPPCHHLFLYVVKCDDAHVIVDIQHLNKNIYHENLVSSGFRSEWFVYCGWSFRPVFTMVYIVSSP